MLFRSVYKQFVDFLLTSPDRTRLIMKAAPEKINVLPVAALILKELLKRFKLDNILISDCGVKEGYLILVATGAENAVPVDLAASVPNYAPVAPPEKKKSDKPSGKKDDKPSGKKDDKPSGKKDGKTEKSKGGKPSESGKKKTAAEKTASGKGKKPPQGKAEKPGGKGQGGAKKSGDGK